MTVNIAIEGWVGSEPRMNQTRAGVPVTSFRMAVNHRRENPMTKEWETFETSWYTVSAYGRLAENVYAKVKMRQPVMVIGNVIIRQWQDDKGRNGTTAELTASSIGFNLMFGDGDDQLMVSPAAQPAAAPQTERVDASFIPAPTLDANTASADVPF